MATKPKKKPQQKGQSIKSQVEEMLRQGYTDGDEITQMLGITKQQYHSAMHHIKKSSPVVSSADIDEAVMETPAITPMSITVEGGTITLEGNFRLTTVPNGVLITW